MADRIEQAAKAARGAYFSGMACPVWEECGDASRENWRRVARALLVNPAEAVLREERLRKAAQAVVDNWGTDLTTCVSMRPHIDALKAALSSPLHQAEPAQTPSKPFYGNALCGQCNAPIGEECFWIPSGGSATMAVCRKCYEQTVPAPSGVAEREDVIEHEEGGWQIDEPSAWDRLIGPAWQAFQDSRNGAPGSYQLEAAAKLIIAAYEQALTDALHEHGWDHGAPISNLLKAIRKRLAHPQADAERVTVTFQGSGYTVKLDGKWWASLQTEEKALTCARGLRAELADASAGVKRGGE